MERALGREMAKQAEPHILLDPAKQAREELGGGQPLPLGQARLIGEQKLGRGDGKALPRRRQQLARSVAFNLSPVRSGLGHEFPLGGIGLNPL